MKNSFASMMLNLFLAVPFFCKKGIGIQVVEEILKMAEDHESLSSINLTVFKPLTIKSLLL